MRQIQLANNKGIALIDDGDFDRVNKHSWCRSGRYAVSRINYKLVLLHHFVKKEITEMDHINGDGLDNRKENLRQATRSQNMGNSRKVNKSTSRFKGVWSIQNRINPWRAGIKHNYKLEHIGVYPTEEEAAQAYDNRAKEIFGEFAHTNFNGGDSN